MRQIWCLIAVSLVVCGSALPARPRSALAPRRAAAVRARASAATSRALAVRGGSGAQRGVAGALDSIAAMVQSNGALGYLAFALFYVSVELLCLPALPLAAGAGIIFGGVLRGALAVLVCGTTSATLSLLIGRSLLRARLHRWLHAPPSRADARGGGGGGAPLAAKLSLIHI